MVLNLKLVLIIISFVFVVNNKPFNPVMDIGVYPNHTKYGINAHTCGLRFLPAINYIRFKPGCFLHNYSDQTIIELNNIRFEERVRTQPEGRILKGQDAERGEGPWAVYIGWKPIIASNFSMLQCTGSLITFEWVLTAAHCIEDGDTETGRYLIVGGPTYNNGWGYTDGNHYRTNAKWIVHPAYDKPSLVSNSTSESRLEQIKSFHDVSLIKLDKPFPEDSESGSYLINTVCLPSKNKSKGFPFKTTNFGYGYKESSGLGFTNDRPSRLQKAEFEVLREGEGYYRVEHNENEPKDCEGDSGSGIVYYVDEYKSHSIIVGTLRGGKIVLEWWDPRSDCQSAPDDWDVFIPTYKFVDWILDTIANN